MRTNPTDTDGKIELIGKMKNNHTDNLLCTLEPIEMPEFSVTTTGSSTFGTFYQYIDDAGTRHPPQKILGGIAGRLSFNGALPVKVVRYRNPKVNGIYQIHVLHEIGDHPSESMEQFAVLMNCQWYRVEQNTYEAAQLGFGFLQYNEQRDRRFTDSES